MLAGLCESGKGELVETGIDLLRKAGIQEKDRFLVSLFP
jgi:hypothetical protein